KRELSYLESRADRTRILSPDHTRLSYKNTLSKTNGGCRTRDEVIGNRPAWACRLPRKMQIGPSAHNVCPYRENTCASSDPYAYTVSPDARYTGPSTILSVGPTIVPGTNNCSSDCAASCNRTSMKAS